MEQKIEFLNQYGEKVGKIEGICNPFDNSYECGDYINVEKELFVNHKSVPHVVAIANRTTSYKVTNKVMPLRFDKCEIMSSDASYKHDADYYAGIKVNKYGLYKITVRAKWGTAKATRTLGISVNGSTDTSLDKCSTLYSNGECIQEFTTLINLKMNTLLKFMVASTADCEMKEAVLYLERVA